MIWLVSMICQHTKKLEVLNANLLIYNIHNISVIIKKYNNEKIYLPWMEFLKCLFIISAIHRLASHCTFIPELATFKSNMAMYKKQISLYSG